MTSEAGHSEHRRPEARPLRRFFQEQMALLLQALGGPPPGAGDPASVEAHIERLVEGTNPRLRVMGDYRRRLRTGTRALLDLVEATVARLPGERPVDPGSFARDSLVNAFFVSVQHISQVLSECAAVQDYLSRAGPGAPVHGALVVTRREKRVLGTVLQDDLLVREVPQVAVSFTGHQVRHPAAGEEQVRREMRRDLFERLVREARGRMHRHCRGPREGAGARGGAPVPLDPDRYLRHLADVLGRPQDLLFLQWRHLRLTRDSILAEGEEAEVVNEVAFPELRLADAEPRALVLIRIPPGTLKGREHLLAEAERVLNL